MLRFFGPTALLRLTAFPGLTSFLRLAALPGVAVLCKRAALLGLKALLIALLCLTASTLTYSTSKPTF